MSSSAPHRGRAALRLRYAAELWQQYVAHDSLPQFDRWLAGALKQYPKFGRQDRRAYSEILFSALRFAYLAAFLDFARQRRTPDVPNGSSVGLAEAAAAFGRLFGAPEDACRAVRRIPPELVFHVAGRRYRHRAPGEWPLAGLDASAQERELDRLLAALDDWRQAEQSVVPDLLWQGIPLWFAQPLVDRSIRSGWSHADRQRFLAGQANRPPLWLRLNHRERRDEVLEELARQGLASEVADDALRVVGERGIYELEAYRSGAIEIQDWASQQIGRTVEAKPGDLVWDACAGGGGKTVQLAAALRNRGALYASDIREYKLQEVRRRAARAGFHNVRTLPWQGEEPPAFGREVAKQEGFHWVLVDAPCSSAGTWRRNPDARFRIVSTSLPGLVALQGQLLSNAATAVRQGGRLVYSTCSWLVDENESVVERFLAGNSGFRLERMALHGCPAADADTMFSAVLTRVS
jgi:16S rRNA (cytosine967-C5)-methyltransferase